MVPQAGLHHTAKRQADAQRYRGHGNGSSAHILHTLVVSCKAQGPSSDGKGALE